MQITLRFSGIFIIITLLLGALSWYAYLHYYPKITQHSTTEADHAMEVIAIRTAGGTMEVASLKVAEQFTRTDSKNFWGIPLGETISQISVPVYYRYHIELAENMPLQCNTDQVCVIQVSDLKATLPIAFDSAKLEKHTANGWGRFNKNQNLLLLEQSLTPLLATRAELNQYKQQARELGRKTISEFVQKWMLKEQQWREGVTYKIIVLYPNEQLEDVANKPKITLQP